MDTQNLREQLEQLHRELQQVRPVKDTDRRTLQQLMADIKVLLEQRDGYPMEKYSGLAERLKEGVAQLEASHPTVTMLMGQTIEMLAKMGI
jgi:uncharacterized coiled-coil DUF342 family protein